MQTLTHRRRNLRLPLHSFDNRPGISKGAGIGRGRAGGDHIQPVARHIRQNQAAEPGVTSRQRQPSALHLVEMLAHRVEFVDGGAAAQQKLSRGLQIGQADARPLRWRTRRPEPYPVQQGRTEPGRGS